MRATKHSLGFVLLCAASACGGTDISQFSYGGDQPGEGLAEGGEVRHENVRMLGMPEMTWIHVYQYKGPPVSANATYAAPDPKLPWGNCVDQRDPEKANWPVKPITGATYLDLPQVTLTGTGINGSLEILKTDPPNQHGNSTFRTYDFTYGGGAPGPDGLGGFNGTLTPAQSTPGGDYSLDIGQGPMDYHMPEAYIAPLGIGGGDPVMITSGTDLVYDWTPPANDMGSDPDHPEHTRKTHFNLTFFVDPTADFPPLFICFPEVEGHQVVPAAVVDALPAGGLMVNANLSHYLEAQKADGELRRFDLVSIYCNISAFQKQ